MPRWFNVPVRPDGVDFDDRPARKPDPTMSLQDVAEVVGPIILFGCLGAYWFVVLRGAARHERSVLKEHKRATRAHFAAIEAAEDDPSFSPDAIEQSVKEVVKLVNGLWHGRSSDALDQRPDAGLMKAWARARQSWLGDDLAVDGWPSVDLLSVVNREDEDEDRVAARVRFRIHCKHPRGGSLGPHHLHVDERWTFGRSDSYWVLLSMSGDPLAAPVLEVPLVPTPSADTARLGEESLAELADAQKVGDDVVLSDLVSPDEPPAYALPDLAVVDSRFGPELIAADLTHILEAWEGAATGSEAPLEELASEDARDALLRPAPGARLFVRDVVLKSWEATRLDLSRRPVAIEVSLEVEAVRYVVDDAGRSVTSNTRDPRLVSLAWTLELTDEAGTPWHLATSDKPAESIPGWP